MSFVDAFFRGKAALDGIEARRIDAVARLREHTLDSASVTATAMPFEQVLGGIRPWILIDARMRKHERPEASRGLAPVTIGIGPGFDAGHTVDLVIESAWGERLGQVIRSGQAISMLGEPSIIGGVGRERFIYAAESGRFATHHQIGQAVTEGETVASIGSRVIVAPLSGQIRGLAHDAADVEAGSKVLEVIPAGAAACFGIGTRPGEIAAGVVRALGCGENCNMRKPDDWRPRLDAGQ